MLAELGESVADEWQYVNDLRDRPFRRPPRALVHDGWRTRAAGRARRRCGCAIEEIGAPRRSRTVRSTGSRRSRRSSGLAVGRSRGCRVTCGSRTRRATVARSSTPASRRIRSSARVAGLLADATPAEPCLARAVMNGERTDPATWRTMFPTLFAPTRRPEQRELAERLLGASLEVAERGEQSRSQFRGAIVEELTARLLARRVPPDSIRRERRVLFDGVAGRDPSLRRHRRAGRREPRSIDCKWGARGINADVLHQLDDARTPRRRRGRESLRGARDLRFAAIGRGAAGAPDRAADRDAPVHHRVGRVASREVGHDRGAVAEQHSVGYRARFDECGPDGVLRSSGYLRWAQDAPGFTPSGSDSPRVLVRRARPVVARPLRRAERAGRCRDGRDRHR